MEDRRLAAIMFTDIVGYTALMGSDEKKAFGVLRKNRNIQKPIIKKYRGKWLKEMGDGILASFDTASDAVRCAGEIQKQAGKEGIGLRIGIHLGEVVFQEGDVLGDGVNVASRLEELAETGSIYVSGAIYKNVKNKEGIRTEFIEEKSLKGVDEPVRIYRVECKVVEDDKIVEEKADRISQRKLYYYILAAILILLVGGMIWYKLPDQPAVEMEPTVVEMEPSIAVLPFYNDSPDKNNEYFCNGMMEEILTNLQKISDLEVKSRTAVEGYRNTTKDPEIIGAELGVSFLVEGSVRKVENDIRINVQLINTNTGNHVWAEPYDGRYTSELLTFQSIVAQKVAASINANITEQERSRIGKTAETDMEVYDQILRARELINQFWATHDRKYLPSILFFIEKALEIDPDSPLANLVKGGYFIANAFKQKEVIRGWSLDSALYYSDKAIKQNPESFNAYRIKADAYRFLGNHEDAIKNISKALELVPNDLKSVEVYSRILSSGQRSKENLINAKVYHRKTIKLYGENTALGLFAKTQYYYSLRDYKKGDEYILKSIKAGITHPSYHLFSYYLLCRGMAREAIQFLDTIVANNEYDVTCHQRYFRACLELKQWDKAEEKFKLIQQKYELDRWRKMERAFLYINTGRKEEGKAELNEIKKELIKDLSKEKTYGVLWNLISIHSILNEKVQALDYLSELEKSNILMSDDFAQFQNSVFYRSIQKESRFKAILKRADEKFSAIRAQVQRMEKEEGFNG